MYFLGMSLYLLMKSLLEGRAESPDPPPFVTLENFDDDPESWVFGFYSELAETVLFLMVSVSFLI